MVRSAHFSFLMLYRCPNILLILLVLMNIIAGPESPFTINAGKMLDLCVKRMGEQEEELIRLEETINPLDDEKYQRSTPQRNAMTPSRETIDSETIPKSILDLTISDTEDEGEPEASYLDGRACPVVP